MPASPYSTKSGASPTELLKPVRDLLHRGSAPDYRASPPAIGEFIPNGYSVGVEVGTCLQLGKVLAYRYNVSTRGK
jgi:hypothetical protein